MDYKINSIFYSIQGEGHWTGTPAVFIRMANCNRKCGFCDAEYEEWFRFNASNLVHNTIQLAPPICKHIVITGGEPFLQDLRPLIKEFTQRDFHKTIHIETNGDLLPVYQEMDRLVALNNLWITYSPKEIHRDYKCVDEIKLVYTGDVRIMQHLEEVYGCDDDSPWLFLQPCDGMDNVQEVVNIVKERPWWRLSLQTHKLIGIK